MSESIELLRVERGECVLCAAPLPEERSAKRVYCGELCRKRHYRIELRREAAAQLQPERTCQHCGKVMPRKPEGKAGPDPSYCDRTCRAKAKHSRTYVPKPTVGRPRKYGVGHRFGALVVVEYLGKVNGSTRLRCRCDCGTVDDFNLSNLRNGRTIRCANRDHHPHPLTRQTPPTDYDAAHRYVRTVRGRASAFVCRCGKPAEQWAYSHADLDARRNEEGREAGLAFSQDPAHYVPMCRSCHSRFDRAHSSRPGGGNSLPHHALWVARQEECGGEAA